MESLKVEIVGRKMIKPSVPTPNHLQNLHLSLFDQLAPPMYVHILFYFLPHSHRHFSHSQMQKSLSQALIRFYPLSGRLIRDDLLIRCTDQGVDYLEANVDGGSLQDLVKEKDQLEDSVRSLFLPPPENSAASPLLAVQITGFGCSGFVLGLRISHVIADAFSMMAFIKEWACLSNNTMISDASLSSFYANNVVSIFPTIALSNTGFAPRPVLNLARVSTTRFLFDEAVISNRASSRVVVVLAMIWQALTRVSTVKHGQFRDSSLVFSMNLRGKCKADLLVSELCSGNFWIPFLVQSKRKEKKTELELEELMMLIQNAITSTSEKVARASAKEISSLLVNSWTAVFEQLQLSANNVDVYICTSWCRLDMYEVDFGWGKPCWISQASKSKEGVVLMDAKSGNGIEAWISLDENDMFHLKRQLPVSVPNSVV